MSLQAVELHRSRYPGSSPRNSEVELYERERHGERDPISNPARPIADDALGEPSPIRGEGLVAVILSGGRGLRLRPVTALFQKTMLPGGFKKRILDFAFEFCGHRGRNGDRVPVLLVTGYRAVEVAAYVGHRYQLTIHREDVLGGPAAAILSAWNRIKRTRARHIAIVPGDHYIPGTLKSLYEAHLRSGGWLTLAGVNSSETSHDYLAIKGDTVVGFSPHSGSSGNVAFTGIAIVRTTALEDYFGTVPPDSIHDLLPAYRAVLKAYSASFYLLDSRWSDLGTWRRYMRFLSKTAASAAFRSVQRICEHQLAYLTSTVKNGVK